MELQEKVKHLIKTALNKQILREMEKWPPAYFSSLYQPQRPATPQRESQKTAK